MGYDATSIHIDFKTAYGEQAPSYKTVLRWINRFKDGKEDLEDDPRAGRPQTGLTEANIEQNIEANLTHGQLTMILKRKQCCVEEQVIILYTVVLR